MIWLAGFPLPPSVNDYLMPVAGPIRVNKKTGRRYTSGRMVKTAEHQLYLRRCHEWRALHNRQFTQIQDELLRAYTKSRRERTPWALRVDCFFAFENSRLWTQTGLPQTIDADNRLKPCRDALSALLGIDDKYFFSGYFEKVSAPLKESECTYIRIVEMTPRNVAQLRLQIRQEMEMPKP